MSLKFVVVLKTETITGSQKNRIRRKKDEEVVGAGEGGAGCVTVSGEFNI